MQRSPKHVDIVDDPPELIQHVAIDAVVELAELPVVFVDGLVQSVEHVAVADPAVVDSFIKLLELRPVLFVRDIEHAAVEQHRQGQEQVIVSSSLDRSSMTIVHGLMAKIRCIVAAHRARAPRRDVAYL